VIKYRTQVLSTIIIDVDPNKIIGGICDTTQQCCSKTSESIPHHQNNLADECSHSFRHFVISISIRISYAYKVLIV